MLERGSKGISVARLLLELGISDDMPTKVVALLANGSKLQSQEFVCHNCGPQGLRSLFGFTDIPCIFFETIKAARKTHVQLIPVSVSWVR